MKIFNLGQMSDQRSAKSTFSFTIHTHISLNNKPSSSTKFLALSYLENFLFFLPNPKSASQHILMHGFNFNGFTRLNRVFLFCDRDNLVWLRSDDVRRTRFTILDQGGLETFVRRRFRRIRRSPRLHPTENRSHIHIETPESGV